MTTNQETETGEMNALIEEFRKKIPTSRRLAQDAEKFIEALGDQCFNQDEFKEELRDEVRAELRVEVRNEVKEELAKDDAATLRHLLNMNPDATLRSAITGLAEIYEGTTNISVNSPPLHLAAVCSYAA